MFFKIENAILAGRWYCWHTHCMAFQCRFSVAQDVVMSSKPIPAETWTSVLLTPRTSRVFTCDFFCQVSSCSENGSLSWSLHIFGAPFFSSPSRSRSSICRTGCMFAWWASLCQEEKRPHTTLVCFSTQPVIRMEVILVARPCCVHLWPEDTGWGPGGTSEGKAACQFCMKSQVQTSNCSRPLPHPQVSPLWGHQLTAIPSVLSLIGKMNARSRWEKMWPQRGPCMITRGWESLSTFHPQGLEWNILLFKWQVI